MLAKCDSMQAIRNAPRELTPTLFQVAIVLPNRAQHSRIQPWKTQTEEGEGASSEGLPDRAMTLGPRFEDASQRPHSESVHLGVPALTRLEIMVFPRIRRPT